MPVIKDLIESLDKIKQIHELKNNDYATNDNPFSNFDVQEYLVKLFNNDRDKVFIALIAIKIARLGNLLSKSSEPNNESIEDSFIDLATYTLLWKADFVNRKNKFTQTILPGDVIPVFPNEKPISLRCTKCDKTFTTSFGIIFGLGYDCPHCHHANYFKG